nr:polymerase [Lonestar tick totivirus]
MMRGLAGCSLTAEGERALNACFIEIVSLGRVDLFCDVCVSLCARGYRYTPGFLAAVLVGSNLWGRQPPACFEKLYKLNTSLRPPQWMDVLTIDQVCARVRDEVQPDLTLLPTRPDNWEELVDNLLSDPTDDRLAVAAFPPRTKSDLGVRNIRIADLVFFMRQYPKYGDIRSLLVSLKLFDYITVCNLLLGRIVFFGTPWWTILEQSGCLAAGSEHFRLAGKCLYDIVKKETVAISADLRVSLYEVGGLYGAMTPPVPSWDPIEETRALAESGQTAHGLLFTPEYSQQAILDYIRGLVDHAGPEGRESSFREWLESAEWERAGSSSLGTVEYEVEIDGEKVRDHFKARKNLVLDVIPLDDLEQGVRTCTSQDNVALVKSEFAKIRIAVSSPLLVYLGQAWLYDLAGTYYKSWPGNTLEESPSEEAFRNETTFRRLSAGWFALPYDFSRFDHQPTTKEVLAFHDVLVTRAFMGARPEDRHDVLHIANCQRQGFAHATLRSPPGIGEQQTFKVTGGLMSGLRSTSSVGSGWNLALGKTGERLVNAFRRPDSTVKTELYVRGDDTQVLSQNYHDVLGIKIAYDALGAEANESKFTLRRGRSEFLRIETSDRARGYPCRTVPLAVQRCPWNARPAGPEAIVSHVAKVLATLGRRVADPSHVHEFRQFYVDRMLNMYRMDIRLKRIPVGLGGLGVEAWDGRWAVKQWRQPTLPPIRIINHTSYREKQVEGQLRSVGLPIKKTVIDGIVQSRLQSKAALDDIPKLSPLARRALRSEMRSRSVVRAEVDRVLVGRALLDAGPSLALVSHLQPYPGAYGHLLDTLRSTAADLVPEWGSRRKDMRAFTLLSEYARHGQVSLGKLLRTHLPEMWHAVVDVERRYGVRRNVAIDIVTGSLAVDGAETMNPMAPRVCRLIGVITLGKLRLRGERVSSATSHFAFCEGARVAHLALLESSYGKCLLRN